MYYLLKLQINLAFHPFFLSESRWTTGAFRCCNDAQSPPIVAGSSLCSQTPITTMVLLPWSPQLPPKSVCNGQLTQFQLTATGPSSVNSDPSRTIFVTCRHHLLRQRLSPTSCSEDWNQVMDLVLNVGLGVGFSELGSRFGNQIWIRVWVTGYWHVGSRSVSGFGFGFVSGHGFWIFWFRYGVWPICISEF